MRLYQGRRGEDPSGDLRYVAAMRPIYKSAPMNSLEGVRTWCSRSLLERRPDVAVSMQNRITT
jgi:hypothetical protein